MLDLATVLYIIQLKFQIRHGRNLGVRESEQELERFEKWMYGQTHCVLEGKHFYYLTDVIRFCNNQPIVD